MSGDAERRYLAVRVQVGWGDCDPAGIVFYPRFYAWMDMVSHVLAREMGIPRESMIPPGPDMFGFPPGSPPEMFLPSPTQGPAPRSLFALPVPRPL